MPPKADKSTDNTSDNGPHVFAGNKSFPDAAGVFYSGYLPVENITESCIVVLDTNALLVPYGIGKQSLGEIGETYRSLAQQQRLVIPGQVAREFARNRPKKLLEIHQSLSRKRDLQSLQRGRYPLLGELEEYERVLALEAKVDALLADYRTAVGDLLKRVQGWTWNDPVSAMYSGIFPAAVVDEPVDEDGVLKALDYQKENKLPPGYKDSSKADRGVGDLLIWHDVLSVARNRGAHAVLVSGDVKSDWFHRSDNQAIFPRFELVDEFRRASNGKTLHIVAFSRFLELFGATETAVREVREEEVLVRVSDLSERTQSTVMSEVAADQVYQWLRKRYPEFRIARRNRLVDITVEEPGGATLGVRVNLLDNNPNERALVALGKASNLLQKKKSPFDSIVSVLIATSSEGMEQAIAAVKRLSPLRPEGLLPVVAQFQDGDAPLVFDPLGAFPDFD